MTNDSVDAFSRAMLSVLEESGFQGISIDAAVPRSNTLRPAFEVSIAVGMAGAIRGYVFLQCALATATSLAAEIARRLEVPMENQGVFGAMHRAALAELANQVSGRAAMYLADLGLDTYITPPTVLTGENVSMGSTNTLTFYDSSVRGLGGDFTLVLGIESM